MRICVTTEFDITATGVTGHYKPARGTFRTRNNDLITDETTWNRARNQQRNWETVLQLLQMRAQITIITEPVKSSGEWSFEFEVDTPAAYGTEADPTQILRQDANGVPMLIHMESSDSLAALLITDGPEQNIHFTVIE